MSGWLPGAKRPARIASTTCADAGYDERLVAGAATASGPVVASAYTQLSIRRQRLRSFGGAARLGAMTSRENVVYRKLLYERLPLPGEARRPMTRWLVDSFHRYYYRRGAYKQTTWLGVPTLQYPGDLVVLQQIVWETRPELIVETGTFGGGTALFFASMLDLLGAGEVVTIDIDHSNFDARAEHPRIRVVTGDSTSSDVLERIRRLVEGRRTMVHLDADHREPFVSAELAAYSELVTPGCYIVVADSNINGHPVEQSYPSGVGGPFEAIQQFLAGTDEFEVDRSREYHLVTFNPGGYLRRREQ
jgi:cephalosporin hydroxylase